MRILSGANASFAPPPPPPGTLALPLLDLFNKPRMAELFLAFAAQAFHATVFQNTTQTFKYLFDNRFPPITSGLCRYICDRWLSEFIDFTTTTAAPIATTGNPLTDYDRSVAFTATGPKATVKTTISAGGLLTVSETVATYKTNFASSPVPPVTGAAELTSLLQAVHAARPLSRLYSLIGAYHFVVWYLSIQVVSSSGTGIVLEANDGNPINSPFADYINQELAGFSYSFKPTGKPDIPFAWNAPVTAPAEFANAFAHDRSLRDFTDRFEAFVSSGLLTMGGRTIPDYAHRSPEEKFAVNAGLRELIRQARALLAQAVQAEVIQFLKTIDVELALDYGNTQIKAVGAGDESYGFFGIRNFALLFFQYEFDGTLQTDADFLANTSANLTADFLKFLGVKGVASLDVSGANSVFITSVGMDQNFSDPYNDFFGSADLDGLVPNVKAVLSAADGSSLRTGTLYAVLNGTCELAKAGGAAFYNPFVSSISLDGASCASLALSTNVNGESTLSSNLSLRLKEELAFFVMPNDVPAMTPSASAEAHWLLNDNNFYDPNEIPHLFEETPGHFPGLDAIIAALVLDGDAFTITADLSGQGIGTILPQDETVDAWRNVQKSRLQKDIPRPRTTEAKNAPKRHASASLAFYQIGTDRQLKISVVGFTSPVRCTWDTKYPYPNSAAAIGTQVGDYVAAFDKDDKQGPWYNGALSSFRAFGLLKAIFQAIDNRVAALNLTAVAPYISTTLQTYLEQEARVAIETRREDVWVTKPGTPPRKLFVNHLLYTTVTQ